MWITEELTELTEGMAARGELKSLEALTRLLDHLIHDLNNSLGTFGLELYSVNDLCQRLSMAMNEGASEELARQIESLQLVYANLDDANETATKLIKSIDEQNQACMSRCSAAAEHERR